jgi:uncharacterized protein
LRKLSSWQIQRSRNGDQMRESSRGFTAKYGPWALVIGAGEGIGAEFCRQLASRGLRLVLVALEQDALKTLSYQLTDEHGIETRLVVGDIGHDSTMAELLATTKDLEVGLVVYNAGLAIRGLWLETDLEEHLRVVDVNIRGMLKVLHSYGALMVSRRRGGVILLSSMSGLQGSPVLATYAATKAFILNMGESLWDEWRSAEVSVTVVVPGPTDTPGYRASEPTPSRLRPAPMDVQPVVFRALESLGVQLAVVPGTGNKIASVIFGRLLPRKWASAFMGRTMRTMYPHDLN